jgi:hypothetical protein
MSPLDIRLGPSDAAGWWIPRCHGTDTREAGMSSHPTDFKGSVADALREAIERQIPSSHADVTGGGARHDQRQKNQKPYRCINRDRTIHCAHRTLSPSSSSYREHEHPAVAKVCRANVNAESRTQPPRRHERHESMPVVACGRVPGMRVARCEEEAGFAFAGKPA